MNPRDMTNEQLAAAVEEMFNSPDFDRIKFEAARRLRGPDYKAEAMAARKLITNLGHGQFWTPDRDKSQYEDARTTNEAKERTNG